MTKDLDQNRKCGRDDDLETSGRPKKFKHIWFLWMMVYFLIMMVYKWWLMMVVMIVNDGFIYPGWLSMVVFKWWYIHHGLVTFFCHALVGDFFSQHWPDGIMIPDADVDVCIPCSISHDSFIYTSLYIIIPIYINLYINLYHSIYHIYGLHGLYCCCSTCSSWHFLAFFGRLFGLRHRYGCAKSVKIIWHGQADSHRARVTMYLEMSQVRNKLWTRSRVVSRCLRIC